MPKVQCKHIGAKSICVPSTVGQSHNASIRGGFLGNANTMFKFELTCIFLIAKLRNRVSPLLQWFVLVPNKSYHS